MLSKGDRGNKVEYLQKQLVEIGYYLGKNPYDGVFGDMTETTIKGFQYAFGLKADGLYGNTTENKLTSLLSKKSSTDFFNIDTEHFSQKEFNCKCCNTNIGIPASLLLRLELVRMLHNEKIYITSGYRCQKHNEAINGAKHSYHVRGKASDIKSNNLEKLYKYCEKYCYDGGLCLYDTFIHVDVRGCKARW